MNLFVFGLIAGLATDKNVTVTETGDNLCYQCYSNTDPDSERSQDCFDESKLQKKEYQCTRGKS